MNELLLAFYGDDFTGSADAMEALTVNGVRTALFLGHPTPARLQAKLPDLQAIGISGVSRTMTPARMDDELPGQFALLDGLAPRLLHYKVCATFDSSPAIGSIGHAADLGFAETGPDYGVIVQGVPILGRYIVFGNHFTVYGDGRYRLDRHPVMSRHPITPMAESDLRRLLAGQTNRRVELIDLLHLREGPEAVADRLDRLVAGGAEIVLFDTLDDDDLLMIGGLLHRKSATDKIFVVGSSGFEYAMARYWRAEGIVAEPDPFGAAGPVDRLIVMSGSAAANTAAQIDYARSRGFAGIALRTDRLLADDTAAEERRRAVGLALDHLGRGESIVVSATIGPDDPVIGRTRDAARRLGLEQAETGARIGRQQGLILRELLEATGLRRVCVAGGDTCSHTLRQLDIHSLELLMPIAPAAPLCRTGSDHPGFDGLQVASKGGQIGAADYFLQVKEGRP